MRNINELKRGDRFITREGQFGDHVQDYFVLNVSTPWLAISAQSANMSENKVADEHDLRVYDPNVLITLFLLNGRWYSDWDGKKNGPNLLESVEFPTECVLCDGVRSVRLLHGEPLCINCWRRVMGDRICDCDHYGEHIPVFCTVCGAAHSTKNIESIGARHVHAIYEDSCACSKGWFFHDCRAAKFVKGSFVDGKFVPWVDKYKESK